MAKQGIIPVRVSSADRAALKAAAGEQPVSTWLRDLGLAEARRRASTRSVGEILDSIGRAGPGMTDEEAAELADEAIHAVRRSRRR
jgi:hypothetical protein